MLVSVRVSAGLCAEVQANHPDYCGMADMHNSILESDSCSMFPVFRFLLSVQCFFRWASVSLLLVSISCSLVPVSVSRFLFSGSCLLSSVLCLLVCVLCFIGSVTCFMGSVFCFLFYK